MAAEHAIKRVWRFCDNNGVHPRWIGRLDDDPIKKGCWRVLAGAEYRSDKVVTQNMVILRKAWLPEDRDEPWFRMTDLPGNSGQWTALYARRMAVEELLRDGKSVRSGFGLRHTQVTTTARLDRLILILALALSC